LSIWIVSRVVLASFVLIGAYLFGEDAEDRARDPVHWAVRRFGMWDAGHFARIAREGYFGPGRDCCDQAYFPGYPLVSRTVAPLVGGDALLAGVLVAWIAGAVATVMVWRLGVVTAAGDGRAGTVAALVLVFSPYALFLSAGYSESLFLALAIAAWWAGTTGRWGIAGLLAAGAAAVRVNGVFLAAGLIVLYAQQLWSARRRPGSEALALLLPGVVTVAYFAWLHAVTGSWDDWRVAQVRGWDRTSGWPWQSLHAGWQAAQHATTPDLVVSRWAELVAAVGGIALVAALVVTRRWAEMVYVATSLAAMLCSTVLYSLPRAALLWFPAYLLLGRIASRWPRAWLLFVLLALSAAFQATLALAFATHHWVA